MVKRAETEPTRELQPLSDFLIVQMHDDPAEALIIPGGRVDIPKVGTVLRAGPGYHQNGQLIPNPVKNGDIVLLQIGAGTDVKMGGVVYKFVPSRDLFGVFS